MPKLSFACAAVAAVGLWSATACAQRDARAGPPTPDTCFWAEREFKTIPERGSREAKGVVLWSHGQSASRTPSWIVGAPPVIRLFAEAGWDVLLVQRNERCEGDWDQRGQAYVDNLVDEVARAKQAGYQRILAAGQSFGAGTALGASARTTDIDCVLAFALSHGRGSCRSMSTFRPSMVAMHERAIRQGIQEAKAPRILISMGKDDHCVGHSFTPLVSAGLEAKKIAYIHLDEAMPIAGHGAATRKEFAALYGDCLLAFFAGDSVPGPGRHVCKQ